MKRQGDILFVPASGDSGVRQRREGGRYVLAHGEATGHAHAIYDEGCEVFVEESGRLRVVPSGEVHVRHEEHAPVMLRGPHDVVRQREWTDDDDRQVAD